MRDAGKRRNRKGDFVVVVVRIEEVFSGLLGTGNHAS